MSHKIISINPDAFRVKGGGTRKRKPKIDTPEIKVRTPVKKNTISNRNTLLKFIRNHQDKNYNDLMNPSTSSTKDLIEKNEFDETLQYLMDITKDIDKKETELIKNHIENHIESPRNLTLKNTSNNPPSSSINTPKTFIIPPKYGCLKGGSLPTYRQYMHNETFKNTSFSNDNKQGGTQAETQCEIQGEIQEKSIVNPEENLLKRFPKISDINDQQIKPPSKMLVYPTQKKIIRRTYKIGKSKIHPKVSVLISNRTIRKNITTKTQLLKQTPIHDVKSFLIKRGLIKIGTIAPNDVLRQMYESTTLLCGDIYNHNPETILYNFFNEK